MLISISVVIFKLNKESFNNNPFYTICWALCKLLIFVNKTLPRPHLFSFLFFASTIYIVNSIKNKNNKLFYISPFISILWSNIHGGSSNLSYIIYGIFLFFSILNKDLGKMKKYIYTFITSLFCILINPHGIKMIFYPYINMTYDVMIDCIDEWQSLNILSADGFFYTFFIISILYIIVKNRSKIKLIDICLLTIFIILGIKSTRFMPYLFIVSSSIIPGYWKNSKIKIDLLPILCFLIITVSFFIYICIWKRKLPKSFPGIINYLKTNEITLYNSYNLGGYLIYNDIKVFLDSRADLFIDTILCEVCQIEKERKTELVDKYNFDTFLVENNSNLYDYLNTNQKYKLLLQDKNNSLFILKPEN